MCGIVGIHYFDQKHPVDRHLVGKMCDAIIHRGPDDDGIYLNKGIGLGMRRLSIIDLHSGKQPIFNEDHSVVIVFNGEVYNFKQLRETLESKGHRFSTRTDTESILHGYEEYGVHVLEHLNGMFSFAIWDSHQNQLFVARDRLGIKPLYYWQDHRKVIFASEIKSILEDTSVQRTLEHEALPSFLSYGYVPAPKTMFHNIRKLEAGHFMLIKDGCVTTEKYWDLPIHEAEQEESFSYYCEKTVELLTQSIKLRLVADVPLGAFLSGGMDSSSIVAIMSKLTNSSINTYAIGFDEQNAFHNELSDAKAVAQKFHTNHHEILVKPNVIDLLPKLIAHMDEPVADSSIIVTYLVSKLAQESVKVILSGVGGDELFGGYRRYLGYSLNSYYQRIPSFLRKTLIPAVFEWLPSDRNSGLMNFFRLGKGFIRSSEKPEHEQYHDMITIFNNDFLQEVLTQSSPQTSDLYQFYTQSLHASDSLKRMLNFDIKTQLVDDLLLLTDKMSMAASLEARVPFLDHNFVEFASTIPSKYKIHGLQLRHIQKKAMQNILPREVIEKKKKGFGCPIGNWIKSDLYEYVADLLSEDRVKRRGYFNPGMISKIMNDHYKNRADYTDHIFALLSFELWHQIYIDG